MKPPPLLLGFTLLFWGWQSGWLAAGALLGAVLEVAPLVKVRWELTDTDFRRLWNVCTVLFLGAALYLFSANDGLGAARGLWQPGSQSEAARRVTRVTLQFLQWLPLVFFAVPAAQAYSSRRVLPLSVFSWIARRQLRRRGGVEGQPGPAVDAAWPYFAIVWMAASVAPRHGAWFFAGAASLLGVALWVARSPRYRAPVWGATLAAAVAVGGVSLFGVARLQYWLENYNPNWFLRAAQRGFDPKESRTALGQIGVHQLSGRIVHRVTPRTPAEAPTLLREASYHTFRSPTWYGAGADQDFTLVGSGPDELTWLLLPRKRPTAVATIASYLRGGRGVLALPAGTARLDDLPAFVLKTNRLGTVLVDSGPGLVVYDAHYGPGTTLDSPPTPEDQAVPEAEEPSLRRVLGELGLDGWTPLEVVARLHGFFQDQFRYRSYRLAAGPRVAEGTPLSNFLLTDRAGHCELFATATVLLLRAAGIPARYAAGYAVQEQAGRHHVVRQRHAHAWGLAFIDGAWRDVDTTPAGWTAVEAQRASWFEPIADGWQWLWYQFSRWRWGQAGWRSYVPWLVVPVLAVLVTRIVLDARRRRARASPPTPRADPSHPGLDSEYYLLEQQLRQLGQARPPDETPARWLERVSGRWPTPANRARCAALAQLHYRYRFDPAGLDRAARLALSATASALLEDLRSRSGG